MSINTQNYKNRIRESLEGFAFDYQWEEAYKYCFLKQGDTIDCSKYTSNTVEFASEEEQEAFWELSESAKQIVINKLGVIYDEVFEECYDEYKQEEYEDEMIIKERGSLCY
jgi:hypothetical protein